MDTCSKPSSFVQQYFMVISPVNVATSSVKGRVRLCLAMPLTTNNGRIRAPSRQDRHRAQADCHLYMTRQPARPTGWLRSSQPSGQGRSEPRPETHSGVSECRHLSGMTVELRSCVDIMRCPNAHTSPISLAFSNISTCMPSFRHDIAQDRPPEKHEWDPY
jgi:hypothetical protein